MRALMIMIILFESWRLIMIMLFQSLSQLIAATHWGYDARKMAIRNSSGYDEASWTSQINKVYINDLQIYQEEIEASKLSSFSPMIIASLPVVQRIESKATSLGLHWQLLWCWQVLVHHHHQHFYHYHQTFQWYHNLKWVMNYEWMN